MFKESRPMNNNKIIYYMCRKIASICMAATSIALIMESTDIIIIRKKGMYDNIQLHYVDLNIQFNIITY